MLFITFQLGHDESDSDHSVSPTPMPNAGPRDHSPIPEIDLLNLSNSCEPPASGNASNAAPVNLLDIDGDTSTSASNFDLLSNAPLIGRCFYLW